MTYGLEKEVRNAKKENEKIEKKFFNVLLDMCMVNAVVDWDDKDPQKEFKELGRFLTVYMIASGIEVDLENI